MKKIIENILRKLDIYYFLLPKYVCFAFWRDYGRHYHKTVKQNGFVCNVCNSSYENFVPSYPDPDDKPALDKYQVYAGFSENDFCPDCMSTCRERLIIAMLQNEIDYEDRKILHFAPEKTIFSFLRNKARIITADYFPDRYKHIDRKIIFADITKLHFSDNEFDIIIANHILEHIPDDKVAMKELYRILKPTGQAILQIPYSVTIETTLEDPSVTDPKKKSALFGQYDHVRIYSMNDYIHRLKEVAFSVDLIGSQQLQKYKQNALQLGETFFIIRK